MVSVNSFQPLIVSIESIKIASEYVNGTQRTIGIQVKG